MSKKKIAKGVSTHPWVWYSYFPPYIKGGEVNIYILGGVVCTPLNILKNSATRMAFSSSSREEKKSFVLTANQCSGQSKIKKLKCLSRDIIFSLLFFKSINNDLRPYKPPYRPPHRPPYKPPYASPHAREAVYLLYEIALDQRTNYTNACPVF